jgi:hypothetical protein
MPRAYPPPGLCYVYNKHGFRARAPSAQFQLGPDNSFFFFCISILSLQKKKRSRLLLLYPNTTGRR